MRNVLKAETLERKFPLLSVENGCIVSKDADLTVAFEVELPELYTVTAEEYEAMHSTWIKAARVLPEHSIVCKQDWFTKESYRPQNGGEEQSFLSRSYERHFNERPYLNHRCYLYLTKTTRERNRRQSDFSTLCRGFLLPREITDKDMAGPAPLAGGVFYPEKAERVSHFRPGKDFTRISILNTLLVLGALLFYYPWRFLRSLTRENIRRFVVDNITRSKDSNPRLAASIGLGVFFGIAPLWGYQMIAAAVTAHFTHLNKAVAVISSNISIPPMIPFILYGSYWTGAQVLQRDMPLSLSDITLERVAADLVQYIAGSFTMAAVCGAAATAGGDAPVGIC